MLKHAIYKSKYHNKLGQFYSTLIKEKVKQGFHVHPKLDYNYLATNVVAIQQNIVNRGYERIDLNQFAQLNEERNQIKRKLKLLNTKQEEVNVAMRRAIKLSQSAAEEWIEKGKQLKLEIKPLDEKLSQIEDQLLTQGLKIPNDAHPNSPIGSEENARIIKTIGTPRNNNEYQLKDHLQIATELDIIDIKQAAIGSGSSFYYLQGMGAFLELALIQYAMHKAHAKGFYGVLTPDIVRTQVAYGCGFQPRSDEHSQIYHITTKSQEDPAMCLVGTAEIPLAAKMATRLFAEKDLPIRLAGFGHAFRTEAGGLGRDPKGLYRVHQFSKVELFAVTTPDQSESMMEEIRDLQEEMFSELGLCFRVLDMPTKELGASAYRKYDMEAWMPGRRKWGEISSTSNCTDYQARRLSIRYCLKKHKMNPGNAYFCHTLNGTAIAVPRIIIAILETFQQQDGSVQVPQVLRRWLPGEPEYLTPSSVLGKHEFSF
ncbi:MAG: seryl-tRNA synthetase [Benjaminiella poitrasii]|nr:MAG: seryl-tRNA synthetase [Benjaminiella poitrasii]